MNQPVRTGTGVSDEAISLGVLTDTTSLFKGTSVLRIREHELYLDQANKCGGVRGRRVELKQKDHAYDVQKALGGYFELEPQVLGFIDVTGGPMIVGTTYDLDVINGLGTRPLTYG